MPARVPHQPDIQEVIMRPPIVVGVDPRRHDPEAPVLAALLARATGAPVVAVAAYPLPSPVRIGGGEAYEQELRGGALARLSAIEAAFDGVALETVAVAGPSAAHVLHDVAEDRGAGLVVLGSSHHGTIGRIALGSTTDRLLHGAPCPVLIAPAGFADRMRGIDRVGAAFIDSEEGYEALRAAAALASAVGAELHAVTAIRPIAWSATSYFQPYDVSAHLEGLRAHAEAQLHDALSRLDTHVPASSEVLVNSPAIALEQFSHDIDLLVCGSRGYGPLGSVLLGGVSRRLVHSAACPVLVVPRGTERAIEALAGRVREPQRA
jgi:nucleotide-binding universal stress UspA family protein